MEYLEKICNFPEIAYYELKDLTLSDNEGKGPRHFFFTNVHNYPVRKRLPFFLANLSRIRRQY